MRLRHIVIGIRGLGHESPFPAQSTSSSITTSREDVYVIARAGML
jgi:hypothetical protein